MAEAWKEGTIVKGHGGFYFVESGGQIYTCRLRGKLKRQPGGILVGDRVSFLPLPGREGAVEAILPRQNQLLRPKIANVEQAVLIFAAATPEPDWLLLDKLLLFCYQAGITARICFNKADVATESFLKGVETYRQAGFDTLLASALQGQGVETLRDWLKDRVSLVAGPSGVGKSSLLNAVDPSLGLETGEVSRKLGRGRHTTRMVELFSLRIGGWVADTPGFSLLELPQQLTPSALAQAYPEMARLQPCRFESCLHRKEPGCLVKEKVACGEISQDRYARYLYLLEELEQREAQYHD